jgi:hypothetical protein
VRLDLEDLTLGVRDDGQEVDNNILGLHVQDERERQRLLLAGGDLDVVLDSGQVAKDTSHRVCILRQWLCGGQRSAHEGKLDRLILVVGDLDDRLSGVPIDELDTKARVGEVRGDIDLQVGNLSSGVGRGLCILGLQEAELLDSWDAETVQRQSHAEQSRAE